MVNTIIYPVSYFNSVLWLTIAQRHTNIIYGIRIGNNTVSVPNWMPLQSNALSNWETFFCIPNEFHYFLVCRDSLGNRYLLLHSACRMFTFWNRTPRSGNPIGRPLWWKLTLTSSAERANCNMSLCKNTIKCIPTTQTPTQVSPKPGHMGF